MHRRTSVTPCDIWEEAQRFFAGRSAVHESMRRLVNRLDDARIPYAVVGGMAVHLHGVRRPTDNLDVLLTPADFAEFCRWFVPNSYTLEPGTLRRTNDTANQVAVDFFLTGHHPGIDSSSPITYPDPVAVGELRDGIYVVDLPTLVAIKIASKRPRDLADVVSLSEAQDLDETFANHLHRELQAAYLGCVAERRRDEAWEARNE